MKTGTRYLLCFLVATVLSLGAVVAWRLWPRPLPPEECSELYRTYKDTPGIDATFIKDFHVNDTVSVDVTLLQATDSAGWETLLSNVRMTKDTEEHFKILKNKKAVSSQSFPKGHLGLPPDPVFINNDLLTIDWAEQELAIFHITERKQLEAIISYHLDIVKNNKKQEL